MVSKRVIIPDYCVYPTTVNMDPEHDGLENIVPLRYAYLGYEVEGRGPPKKNNKKSPLVPGETNIIFPLKIEITHCQLAMD